MRKKIILLSILACSLISCGKGIQPSSSMESTSSFFPTTTSVFSTPLLFHFEYSLEGEGGKIIANKEKGYYEENTKITLYAECLNENTKFDGYYEEDTLLSSSITYTFSLTGDIHVIAKFHSNGVDESDFFYQTFSNKFLQDDFNGTGYSAFAGSSEINGLDWSYDGFTFLGQSSDGIQIGSSKKPQTTPWTLSTSFLEDVELISLSISGKNPTGTTLTIEANEYSHQETMQNSTYDTFSFEEIHSSTQNLRISLSASSKAFYFDRLTFTIKTKKNSGLLLKTDEEQATPVVPGQNGVPQTKYNSIPKEEYYEGVNLELKGNDLFSALNNKISTMTAYSYGDDTNIILYTDENPSQEGYLYGIYDGDAILAKNTGIWNKEHVWACSQMGLGGDDRPTSKTKNRSSDLHNLRASCQNSNGQHGNKFYDQINNDITFFPNIEGEKNDSHNFSGDHRGDVARILFYMATRYNELHLDDLLNTNDNYSMGKLSTLLEWNELDPVDEFEIQRNNRIYEYQGNRNPFIDYPELATQIWE